MTLVGYSADPQATENAVEFASSERDARVTKQYGGGDRPPSAGTAGTPYQSPEIVQGVSGEAVAVLARPDENKIRADLQKLFDDGIRSLAVVFIHSYTFPDHEQLVKKIAVDIGFTCVSCSAELMPMIKVRCLPQNC